MYRHIHPIKRILSEHKPELKKKFKMKSIGIFGSYVRGRPNKRSDIDILVEFSEPSGMFVFKNAWLPYDNDNRMPLRTN